MDATVIIPKITPVKTPRTIRDMSRQLRSPFCERLRLDIADFVTGHVRGGVVAHPRQAQGDNENHDAPVPLFPVRVATAWLAA